jgi:hypothetical protein
LEAGDDGNHAAGDRFAHAVGPDLDDLGLHVRRVGDDPGLAAGEGLRGNAEIGERHRDKGGRDPFAGGDEHVVLPSGFGTGDIPGEADEIVGRLTHGGYDDDDVIARPARASDVIGHVADPVRVANRCASEFLNDECHRRKPYPGGLD